MPEFRKGVYRGPDPKLTGSSALLRKGRKGRRILAQFDDRTRHPVLAYGWHDFLKTHFRIKQKENTI